MTRLFHLSDIHFGREDRMALAWVEREIARCRPDALVITGDFTMRARHREFAAARQWIASTGLPVWVEIGNHDMPYFAPLERIRAPFRRYQGLRTGLSAQLEAFPAMQGLALVSLATTRPFQRRWPWVDGWITDEALADCLARIDALPGGVRALVCTHHPLPERGDDGKLLTGGGAAAMEELARRNVAGVLSGHVHDAFDIIAETDAGPLRMIGAGTLSHRLRSTPPGFNELEWDGATLQLHAHNLAGLGEDAVLVEEVPESISPED